MLAQEQYQNKAGQLVTPDYMTISRHVETWEIALTEYVNKITGIDNIAVTSETDTNNGMLSFARFQLAGWVHDDPTLASIVEEKLRIKESTSVYDQTMLLFRGFFNVDYLVWYAGTDEYGDFVTVQVPITEYLKQLQSIQLEADLFPQQQEEGETPITLFERGMIEEVAFVIDNESFNVPESEIAEVSKKVGSQIANSESLAQYINEEVADALIELGHKRG